MRRRPWWHREASPTARRRAAPLLAFALLTGCATTPTVPPAEVDPGTVVDCGPVNDTNLCRLAVEVALTRQLNPPPAREVHLRLARPDDDCWAQDFHPCGAGSIVAAISSGDTIQDVPLVRTDGGWIPFDLVR